ncbi:MAG: nicotinate-nucleotide adenylyltransferase [Anaerolineae bacterium]
MAGVAARRLGILGGTFDPVHFGHLLLAEQARQALELEQVLFVPAGVPPHKLDEPHTPTEHRLRMLELALADNPAFAISRVDVDRPGPHYSVDMVRLIRETQAPGTELFFLMGMDSLANILSWYRPDLLIQLCTLAVARRPSYTCDLDELERRLPGIRRRLRFFDMPLMEISGEDIRRRRRLGHSIRYLTPEPVRRYIEEHGLYRASAQDQGDAGQRHG